MRADVDPVGHPPLAPRGPALFSPCSTSLVRVAAMEPAQRTPEEEPSISPGGDEQTFALRPGQWAGALAALAVMVFLITFAKNYLGDNTPPPPPPPAADLL